ncbi:MAG: endonuclease/exonuclease/phosphatase family protein [Pseudomonadota bacterium]
MDTDNKRGLAGMLWLGLLLLLVALLAGCAVANRFYVPPDLETAEIQGTPAAPAAPDRLSLTTWNVGYAGMGAESDFFLDLGTQRRPLSGALVDRNLAMIQDTLAGLDSDLFLLQEAARPSWVTYRRDVLGGLVTALPGYAWTFGPDVNTRFVPPPFNVQVGNATFSRVPLASAERRGLPLEPTFELGLFRKGYRMHIVRIDADRAWVIVNIHLSTFDSAEDDVRGAQVAALMEFAQAEYARGNHVVIGGDWNLRLAAVDFPHTSDERFEFWVRDFPEDALPEGWRFAIDRSVPTVRGAHAPYVAGENFTHIIDGFLVSPNVRVASVAASNLGFEFTDHHPVRVELVAR